MTPKTHFVLACIWMHVQLKLKNFLVLNLNKTREIGLFIIFSFSKVSLNVIIRGLAGTLSLNIT